MRKVEYFTEKGGEAMEKKSKGNFVDFINDASKAKSPLAKEFFDVVNEQGVTANDLKKFFEKKGYFDVSLDDCKKLLSLPKDTVIGKGGEQY